MFSPVYTLYTYFPLQFFICVTIDLLLIVFGIFLAVRLYRKGRFDKGQVIACIVLFVCYAAVLFLTVLGRRSKEGYYGINLDLFSSYSVLFSGLSLLIEISQLILQCGFFELDDLFNNTLGGLIGIILCLTISLIRRVIQSHRKEVPLESKNDC